MEIYSLEIKQACVPYVSIVLYGWFWAQYPLGLYSSSLHCWIYACTNLRRYAQDQLFVLLFTHLYKLLHMFFWQLRLPDVGDLGCDESIHVLHREELFKVK